MNGFLEIKWILPLAFIAGGILIGLIFEKIVLDKLKRISAKTKWQGDEMVITNLLNGFMNVTTVRGLRFLFLLERYIQNKISVKN